MPTRSSATTSRTARPFARDAAAAGVDGVLVVDYPPEECEAFAAELKANGLDLIFLLAPTSTDERIQQVARIASGYVYYVSLKGVTGAGNLDTDAVEKALPHPQAREDSRWASVSASATRARPRRSARCRRGGDRHQGHPGAWKTSRAKRCCRSVGFPAGDPGSAGR
jgi:sugar phosphate isomerase/epimerase